MVLGFGELKALLRERERERERGVLGSGFSVSNISGFEAGFHYFIRILAVGVFIQKGDSPAEIQG